MCVGVVKESVVVVEMQVALPLVVVKDVGRKLWCFVFVRLWLPGFPGESDWFVCVESLVRGGVDALNCLSS